MSGSTNNGSPHFMQRALDNMWLMLALGILTPTAIYLLWGMWDIINIPVAQ